MRRLLFLVLFFSLGLPEVQAQNDELFQKGNAAYAEGEYQAAVEVYEQILKSGVTAPELHYNLANAYFKLNNLGPSIYHYEKALQLAPGDRDIRNNLQYAQNMRVDAIEVSEQNGFSRWWNSLLASSSTGGWATSGIVFMILFVLLFLAYYFSHATLRKRIFFISGMVFLLLSISAVTLGFLRDEQLRNQNFAIVFAEEVGISSEPNSNGEDLFFLHEGTKVKLLEDYQDWVRIELANGNQGWIQQQAIKKL